MTIKGIFSGNRGPQAFRNGDFTGQTFQSMIRLPAIRTELDEIRFLAAALACESRNRRTVSAGTLNTMDTTRIDLRCHSDFWEGAASQCVQVLV